MSKRDEWTCDGCGEKKFVCNSEMPSNWSRVTVSLEGFGSYPVGTFANGTNSYDLCGSCQQSLYCQCRPTIWPRAAKEPSHD